MIDILIAEDEPAAARYLKSLVELQGPQYRVIATAANGLEAIESIRKRRPDLVITDIRMPIIDGIELMFQLRNEFPDVLTVIVSGFQEFEYARQAVSLGAVDYLLKPLSSASLSQLLPDLDRRITERKRNAVQEFLRELLAGAPPSAGGTEPDPDPVSGIPSRLWAAAVRWFASVPEISAPGMWCFPGRDNSEFLFLADADSVSTESFRSSVRDCRDSVPRKTAAILFSDQSIPASSLRSACRDLGDGISRILVPGRTRVHWGAVKDSVPPTLPPVLVQSLCLAVREAAPCKLKSLLADLFSGWDSREVSARHASLMVKQIFLAVQRENPGRDAPSEDWDRVLEKGLADVDSYDDFFALTWDIVSRIALFDIGSETVDAPAAFRAIRSYIEERYAEPLSIASVCDRFQISQTYLSRLFRKYEQCTFHDFLTRVRLDTAEKIIAADPDILLKTVASCVGYQDPCHFSRAYKTAKGHAPSQTGRE